MERGSRQDGLHSIPNQNYNVSVLRLITVPFVDPSAEKIVSNGYFDA